MLTIPITSRYKKERYQLLIPTGGSELVKFDFTQYAEINGAITTATWTLESGSASISGASLAASIAQAQISCTSAGKSLISLSATDGTDISKQWLEVLSRDPTTVISSDYV